MADTNASTSSAGKTTGMISPQQYAVEIQGKALEKQALWDTINQASQEMVDAQSSKDQFIPGTSETAESLRVKRIAQMESEQKAKEIAKSADWSNLSIILGQDLAALAHEQRTITDKIRTDSAVSLFDDPLQALANAFTLPWDQQALAGVTNKIDTTKKAMDAVNSHVQQSAKTADAIKESVTAETLASESAAVTNLFQAKALNAKIESLKMRGGAIDDILKMNAHRVEAFMHNQKLLDDADARRLRHDAAKRQNQIFDAQMEKIKDEKDADQQMFKFANAALIAEGKDPIDGTRFKLFKQSSAQYLDALVRKGLQLTTQGRDAYTHGTTIEERFKWQTTIGWQPDPNKPQQMTIMSWQNQALNAAASETKDKKLAVVNANEVFNKRWNAEQDEISEGSPFRLPSPKVYAASTDIMKHPIWQKYINNTITEGNATQPLSEETVLNAASTAVMSREVTTSQAAAFVQEIVNKGMALNNTALDFEKIAARKQTKYGYRVGTGIIPYGKNSYDLADGVEIETAIQGKIIRKLGLSGKILFNRVNEGNN